MHGATLAAASEFKAGLQSARARDALIYGECGGYMVLGNSLTDAAGVTHAMTGLLPVETDISAPRRTLGYRRLRHNGALPWPGQLMGHEFHYSRQPPTPAAPPLFTATDASGTPKGPWELWLGG